MQPDVFATDDPVETLNRLLDWRRERTPTFSRELVARRLDVSKSQLINVLRGRRALSPDLAVALCQLLHLSGEETDYVRLLAVARHADGHVAEDARLQAETARRLVIARRSAVVDHPLFGPLKYGMVYEMRRMAGFEPTPAWVAARAFPPMTEAEAAHALEHLRKHDLLDLPLDTMFATEWAAPAHLVATMQEDQLAATRDAIAQRADADRIIYCVTVATTRARLQDQHQQVRRRLMELHDLLEVKEGEAADCVVVLGSHTTVLASEPKAG